MRVVITGAKGFVGQEIALQCKKKGIDVLGIDIVDTDERNYHKADITTYGIKEIIPEECDAIIHLAALSRDKDCKNNAYNCFNMNVMGTLNLIEAAQQRGVKNFIFASTEWVYGTFLENEIKNEDSFIDIEQQNSEYALSKLVSEANLRHKYQNGFCNVSILRFGIIYGPRPSNWSAVETLFNDVRTKDTIFVGSLRTGRCFIHVSDIAAGTVKAIGMKGFNLINLQGDRFVTLGDIIETSQKLLNRTVAVTEKTPDDFNMRNVSNKKAKVLLKWEPQFNIEKGLRTLLDSTSFVENTY